MGFAQSQCELAMELAMNNAEVALNYLLTGEIVAAAPAATSNGQQPLQSTAESYFGQGCGAVTACDVSQYSFGEGDGPHARQSPSRRPPLSSTHPLGYSALLLLLPTLQPPRRPALLALLSLAQCWLQSWREE